MNHVVGRILMQFGIDYDRLRPSAFATAFFLIVTFGYRTKEERAEALAAESVHQSPG